MYSWIWQRLPGNRAIKAFQALVLAAVVIWLLFNYVFPWLEPILPIGRDAVNHSGALGVPHAATGSAGAVS